MSIMETDEEGEHNIIITANIKEGSELMAIDTETISGVADGIELSKEEALGQWKKYYPKEGVSIKKVKVGERVPETGEIIEETT